MATSDSKMTKLSEDIRHLKDEQIQLLKNNDFLMLQVFTNIQSFYYS